MVNYFFRKKILAHASGKGGGKLEQYTTSFIEVRTVMTLISDKQDHPFQLITFTKKKAEESGNSELSAKCSNYLLGEVRTED